MAAYPQTDLLLQNLQRAQIYFAFWERKHSLPPCPCCSFSFTELHNTENAKYVGKKEVLICSVGNVAICLSITMADAVVDPSLNPIFRRLLYFQMF